MLSNISNPFSSVTDSNNLATSADINSTLPVKPEENPEKNPEKNPDNTDSLKQSYKTNPFLMWIYKIIYYILIVCIIILINCNILFILKNASTPLMDTWFPEKCAEYPFGTPEQPTCPPVKKSEQSKSTLPESAPGSALGPTGLVPGQPATVPIVLPGPTAGPVSAGQPTVPAPTGQPTGPVLVPPTVKKGGNKRQKGGTNDDKRYFLSNYLYKEKNIGFPYDRFHKKNDDDDDDHSTLKDITNWLIYSMSETSIATNKFNHNVLKKFDTTSPEHRDGNEIVNRIIFCFGILLLLLVPINLFHTGFRLLWDQIRGLASIGFISISLIIVLLPVSVIAWNYFYTIYKQIILTLKLMFYPLLMGEWKELLVIFNKYKKMIVHIVGMVAIIALWQTPFNPDYALIVKLVPTLLHIYFIIIKLYEYYKNMSGKETGLETGLETDKEPIKFDM